MAGTKTNTIPAAQNIVNLSLRMDNSSSITAPADASGGGVGVNDAMLQALGLCSTDTVARVVQIFLQYASSGTDMLLGSVTVPAGAGTNGSMPAVDVLRSTLIPQLQLDANGNSIVKIVATTKILALPTTTITSGCYIYLTGDVANF